MVYALKIEFDFFVRKKEKTKKNATFRQLTFRDVRLNV